MKKVGETKLILIKGYLVVECNNTSFMENVPQNKHCLYNITHNILQRPNIST